MRLGMPVVAMGETSARRVLFVKEGRNMYGAEQATRRLLKRLDRNQISPSVLVLEYGVEPSQFLAHICDEDVPVFVAYSGKELGVKVRELSPEYDAVVSIGYKCHILIWWFCRGLAIERYAICHGWVATDFKLKVYNWLAQYCLKSCKAVMVVSPTIKVDNPRCVTIFNGVDREGLEVDASVEVTYLNELEEGRTIVYVGRLEKEKGVLELIDAMAGSEASCQLVLAGSGSLRADLELRVKRTGANVRFLGHLDNSAPLIKRADCLILPSISEALPLVILEAMALGTPVLATPVGAVPDVIQDGRNGFILPTNSPGDIQNGLTRVFENDQRLDAVIEQAKRDVEARFTENAVAERVTRVLHHKDSL